MAMCEKSAGKSDQTSKEGPHHHHGTGLSHTHFPRACTAEDGFTAARLLGNVKWNVNVQPLPKTAMLWWKLRIKRNRLHHWALL